MSWCLVYTEGKREQFVKTILEKAQHEIYFPRILVAGRKVPFFPNYLFCKLLNGQFYDVRWTPRVLQVIQGPVGTLESTVTNLRKRERDGYIPLPRAPRPQARKVGDPVSILAGSFEGHVGWYDGQSGADRVRVLLDLLGRKVSVELPERHLSPTPYPLRSKESLGYNRTSIGARIPLIFHILPRLLARAMCAAHSTSPGIW